MRRAVTLAATLLAVLACKGREAAPSPVQQENAALKRKVARLESESAAKDRYIVEAAQTLFAIQEQFEPLAGAQSILAKETHDFETQRVRPETQRQRLLADVQRLSQQFQSNIGALEKLKSDLARSKVHVVELERLIDGMRTRLAADQQRVAELENDLNAATRRITRLRSEVAQKDAAIRDQKAVIVTKDSAIAEREAQIAAISEEANRAYVFVAPLDQFVQNGIVRIARNGFLGMRKVKTLTGRFPLGAYAKPHDKRTAAIVVDAPMDKIEILSSHQAGSYTIAATAAGQTTTITVTDPAKFWTVPFVVIERKP